MSVATIGTRLEQLQTMVAQLTAPAGARPGGLVRRRPRLRPDFADHRARPGAGATAFGAEIDAAAASNGIDPALLKGLVSQESGFDPNARSGAGALGLTQLMPGTAASLGVTNPLDPAQSLQGGAKYLRQQLDRFGGDEKLALAAYNAGPGAVARFGGVPPYAETQNYVSSVLGKAASYRGAIA